MNILELPDEILCLIFDKYLDLKHLFILSSTCNRFYFIIDSYNLWLKYLFKSPCIDFNYPYGKEKV